MGWARFNDDFLEHPKVLAAGGEADQPVLAQRDLRGTL